MGLEGGDLGLLLADHVEQPVLWASAHGLGEVLEDAYHLAFLLIFELLMQLSQARRALVVWTMGPRAAGTGRGALLLHLARRRDGRVVEVQVHADAGSTAGALDVSAHAPRRGPAGVFGLDAGVHGGGGGQRVRGGGRHGA